MSDKKNEKSTVQEIDFEIPHSLKYRTSKSHFE